MYPRTNYEMSEEDLQELLDACKPVPVMKLGNYTPSSPQENANNAWKRLGKKMGFDYMTVRPIDGSPESQIGEILIRLGGVEGRPAAVRFRMVTRCANQRAAPPKQGGFMKSEEIQEYMDKWIREVSEKFESAILVAIANPEDSHMIVVGNCDTETRMKMLTSLNLDLARDMGIGDEVEAKIKKELIKEKLKKVAGDEDLIESIYKDLEEKEKAEKAPKDDMLN